MEEFPFNRAESCGMTYAPTIFQQGLINTHLKNGSEKDLPQSFGFGITTKVDLFEAIFSSMACRRALARARIIWRRRSTEYLIIHGVSP